MTRILNRRGTTPPEGTHALVASGAWAAEETYTACLCLNETPFHLEVMLRFANDEGTIDATHHAMFGDTRKQSTRKGNP